jgi:hypothetical protein
MTQQIALGGASFARLDKLKHVPRGGKPQTVFTTEARRKTKSKAKPEPTEVAEATEA